MKQPCPHEILRRIDDPRPPTSPDQPAWCRVCGALRTKSILGHVTYFAPMRNYEATTIANLIREDEETQ